MFKRLSKKLSLMLAFILIMTSLLGFLTPTGVLAETVYAADLFFSEYIEGSSSNKALEIYNGTAGAVDLSQYTVELYSNGATTVGNSVPLSGTLEAGAVYVIANSAAATAIKEVSNITSTVTYYNGDDALVLKHHGEIIDSFGQVGVDPGSSWGTGDYTTAEHTLVRKPTVISGDSNAMDAFNPSAEWISYPADTFIYLGSHTMTGPVEEGPVAAVTATPQSGAVAVGTKVALECATEGATIRFATDDVVYIEYDPAEQITLDSLPISIKAYAEKEGRTSDISTFNYTLIQANEEVTIAEAKALAPGTEATVTGIVTSAGPSVFIQDDTAGINLYKKTSGDSIAEGDMVRVTGTVTVFNGLYELADYTIVKISSGNPLPEPQVITIAQLSNEYQGELIKISNVTIGAINTASNTTLTDDSGNSTVIYKVPALTDINQGDTVDVVAILSIYRTYQLYVRKAEDVTKVEIPDTVSPVITHTPVTEGNTGVNLTIKAVVTDDRQVSAVKLAYRNVGETTYKYSAMILNNGEYAYTIPKIELSTAGIEYYIEATDGSNTATAPIDISTPYPVVISAEDIAAPEITNMTPSDGEATGSIMRPRISASYSDLSGIDTVSVKLYLDDIDVTDQCTIDEQGITYISAIDLALGDHNVRLIVKDKAIIPNQADTSWSFYVGEKVYNLYFGQLHSHTNISDGEGTLDDAYKWARDQGNADFFAVTDHSNWFDNEKDLKNETIANVSESTSDEWKELHRVAESYNADDEFVAIAGYEMTWSGSTGGWGHINTFNTPWFVSRSNSAMDLKAYYSKLAENTGSISQLNHPGTTFGDFADFGFYSKAADDVVNLIEVGNGEGPIGEAGYFPSYEYYTRALDKGWHVAPSNNQDNHKGGWITANDARTVVIADELTRDGIFDAIRDLRVYSTEDKNLRITYKVNGNLMGATLDAPDALNILINIIDPDDTDKIGKVSIIANGGVEVASKSFDSNEALWELQLDPQYNYYYVRVDQKDEDIAVTAPVWTEEITAVGVSKVVVSQDPQIVNLPVDITATVYNNSASPIGNITVEFYKNSMEAGNKIGEATIGSIISGLSETATIKWTANEVGKYNLYAKATITVNGVVKVFSSSTTINVANLEDVVKIVLDRAHYNAYISGDYAGKDLTLREMFKDRKYMLVENNDELTAEDLEGAKILIITDPQSTDKASSNLFKSVFTDAEVTAIKEFTDNGGALIISSKADYKDGVGEYSNGAQLNKILEAIGTNLRVNDDEVIDKTSNGGQEYRLYFDRYVSTKYNLTDNIPVGTTYSFYSGCSVILKDGGSEEAVDWLVMGHETTETLDSDYHGDNVPVAKGNVNVIGAEVLPSGAKIIVAGTIFFSDFETASSDNAYSNKQITGNILDWMMQPKASELRTIAEVRVDADNNGIPDLLGKRFTIEGRVTAQSEAVTPKNAFFEVIYVQDETGGITVFGVSTTPLPLGTKVRITGIVDQYGGDAEISIVNEANDVAVIQDELIVIEPMPMSTGDSMLEENEGWLVKVQGILTRMTDNSLYLDDGSGEARIYVNGYIGDGTGNQDMLGKWDPTIKIGDTVSAIGLASEDPEGHRIRVRNTAEIVKVKNAVETLEDLLTELYEQGHFKNKGLFNSLMVIIATDNLKALESHLDAQTGKGITLEAAQMLQEYIDILKKN